MAGLVALGVLFAAGIKLDERHHDYGAYFPGRTPAKLAYCGGRHYLRGDPVTSAEIEPAGGSLVAAGRTPGGATLFGSIRTAQTRGETMCPTVVWVADPNPAHLISYVLSGGP